MIRDFITLPRAAGLALCVLLPTAALATDAEDRLAETIAALEAKHDARIGVLVRDGASNWEWGHREDERFLMASTFKSVLCGAVLDRVDRGALTLDEPIAVRETDMVAYAPVTEKHVGGTMTVGALCLATLDMSDNPAANLLIERLGGPQEVTAYLRAIGDDVTRLDRLEPDLNIFAPGDPRDTTSPAAMLSTWDAMLRGDALAPASRERLTTWMSHGGVTGKLIRAHTPEGWTVSDKSGGGTDYTRNLVAMVTPPNGSPYFVAIYLSDTPADFATRNAAVAEIGAAIVDVIAAR
ncbi:class A beta-lactamase [Acuticoccus sp. M5D2P5]|uniref:class A beta-lactamase n=1 Tax=Acuticoccus kalidii TaxID=2910977 RepID=UPI001EFF005D|nr:class A beta-lactamase [Acuticoccus kalidii]MCF3932027.1 class A beta-lactamase [Acuticoccus kalidii]